jgi:hypothetical protein
MPSYLPIPPVRLTHPEWSRNAVILAPWEFCIFVK